MNSENISIHTATTDDAAELLAIYAPYVEKTAVSFEHTVPDEAEFRARIAKTLGRYPYLVAVADGAIVGYAYTSAYSGRQSYAHSAATSIYLREDMRRKGVGRLLYTALEDISRRQNIANLYAAIAYAEVEDEYLTKSSVRFHERMGYTQVGHLHRCGCKFERWYDIVYMEKLIGEHDAKRHFIPLPEL